MRTETRTKQIDYKVYITSDGKEFDDYNKANHHKKILNNHRKECSNCKGKGRVNGRYETITWDYGHKSDKIWKDDKCSECKGRGYFELKWI